MTTIDNNTCNIVLPRQRFAGFDWMRAVFITFVVSMHLNLAQQIAGQSEKVTWSDILQSQIFCTAVPGFLFLAVFLQCVKNPDLARERNLFIGYFYLYVFWVASWTLLTRSRPEPTLWGIISFVLQGGGWAYYFFTVLILVQIIRFFVKNWTDRGLFMGFLLSECIIAGILWKFSQDGHTWMRVETYWWPINALPIPFAAAILSRHHARICNDSRLWWRLMGGGILITAIAVVWEWSLAAPAGLDSERRFLPEYLRISLILTVLAFVFIALKVTYVPRFILFLSRNSLGIFCLHVFILGGVYKCVHLLIPHPVLASVVTLMVIIVGAAWLSELFRKILQVRLV